METTVIHTEETAGGRECPLTITRQAGLQMAELNGKMAEVESVTVFDNPVLGRSVCRTLKRAGASPELRAENRRRLRETAAQAMLDQGIW